MVCIAKDLDLLQRERLFIIHFQIHVRLVDAEKLGYLLLTYAMFSTKAFKLHNIHFAPPSYHVSILRHDITSTTISDDRNALNASCLL